MLHIIKNNCLLFKQNKCLICQLKHFGQNTICQDCQQDLPWLQQQCLTCALPLSSDNNHCPACLLKKPAFDQVYCAFRYEFPIDALIPPGKFNNRTDYLIALSQLAMQKIKLTKRPDCLIPVPMHPQKLLRREYNHAWLLAHEISQQLHLPLNTKILQKTAHTQNQLHLSASERRSNLRNSFSCSCTPPPHVMLVDDVMTTGTTANIISTVLKQAGCKRVDIVALARTDKPSDT